MSTEREFDLVLVGATGFVGRLTAAHLAEHAPSAVRIALAGRSQERLEEVRSSLPRRAQEWPLVVVDTTDAAAVADLAARTRVVVTTVGPYAKLGMPLASACAAAGTHYADLTGEVLFVRDSIDANHEEAERTGARIVHSCGFDSIPSDLGVWRTAQRVAADGEGTLGETVLHVRTLSGGVSGGTIDSMRNQAIESADPARRKGRHGPARAQPRPRRRAALAQPPRIRRLRPLGKVQAVTGTRYDSVTKRWVAPFFMASFNTRIVRRSNALTDWSYGREFRYDEVMDTGRGPVGAVKAGLTTAVLGGLFAGMSSAPTRRRPRRRAAQARRGPVRGDDGERPVRHGRRDDDDDGCSLPDAGGCGYDPGYSGTAIMLGQAGLSLALDELPSGGGVLTPSVAFGEALVSRLEGNDFEFTTSRR